MNKLLANVLFGMGAAALVLTNKPSLARKAKYQLLYSVRADVGQEDTVYRSMGIFEGDAAGDRIKYTADVPMAAAKGIRAVAAMVSEANKSGHQHRQYHSCLLELGLVLCNVSASGRSPPSLLQTNYYIVCW